MYRFANAPAGCVTLGRAAETRAQSSFLPLLSVAEILWLVERRLAWYGLDDWRIKDVVCNRGPSVTVIVRGPARAQLALTIARDGAPSGAELKPAPRLLPAPQGVAAYIARTTSACTAGRGYVLKPAV